MTANDIVDKYFNENLDWGTYNNEAKLTLTQLLERIWLLSSKATIESLPEIEGQKVVTDFTPKFDIRKDDLIKIIG
jgi:hypothetical protein